MKRLVIDASVALKWWLLDEEHGDRALEILESQASESISLHAPALLEFEVANGLAIAKRLARVGDEDAITAMEGFVNIGIALHPISHLFDKVFDYCDRYNLSAYDAAYVALAGEMKTRLVTADKKLFNSTRKLKFVKWIGDFRA
jgi:predicted nucleic acid-binding protein